jgi:glycosyltransferase involved in cell wall biosynthesis
MPKILRIINRFNLGGPTYNVAYLTRYMPPAYETLLAGGPEEAGEDSSLFITEQLGLEPVIIHEFQREVNAGSDYKAYKKIRQLIREFKPDIVHTHASKAGAVGRLAAMHSGVPVIVHTFHGHVFHSYFGKLKTKFYLGVERFLARRTHAIVAISDKQKAELVDMFRIAPAEKFTVIPLGFDLKKFTVNKEENRQSFRQTYRLDDATIAVGIIGRLAPVKNHRLFVESVKYMKDQGSKPFRAFIIGDGDTRAETEAACRELGLSYSGDATAQVDVTFTSWITNIDWALDGLDVVALTSFNEGTPVSLIEAQASGKCIVSTNVGGIQDILNPLCGLLSEPGDHASFFKNIFTAVNSTGLAENARIHGPSWALSRFHYSRLVSDMDSLYRSLLNKA